MFALAFRFWCHVTVSSTLMWAVLTGPADSVCHIGTPLCMPCGCL